MDTPAVHRFYFTGKRKSIIIEIVFLYLSVGDRAQNTPAIWCLSPEKLKKKKKCSKRTRLPTTNPFRCFNYYYCIV